MSGSGAEDDGADWEGMKIGFAIAGSLVAFDCLIFYAIFGICKRFQVLSRGVRVKAQIVEVTRHTRGDTTSYHARVKFHFKRDREVTYKDIAESEGKALTAKSKPIEAQVVIDPRNDDKHMLAATTDDVTPVGLITYFACIGCGFLIACMVAVGFLGADDNGDPDPVPIAVGIILFGGSLLVTWAQCLYYMRLVSWSKGRVVSGTLDVKPAPGSGDVEGGGGGGAAAESGAPKSLGKNNNNDMGDDLQSVESIS